MTVSLPTPHVSFFLACKKFQKTRSEILFRVNFSKKSVFRTHQGGKRNCRKT
jgi:hypothetical protein